MKQIPLTKGQFVLVDEEDYKNLNQFKWYCSFYGYAVRNIHVYPGQSGWRPTMMHRIILGLSRYDKRVIDHINGNKLDNRKENLRICTQAQNAMNARRAITNKSGFKGVSWDKQRGKWKAYLSIKNKQKLLGRFIDKVNAAKAYNKAAKYYRGEFASLNDL
jgi:hypothetical protein